MTSLPRHWKKAVTACVLVLVASGDLAAQGPGGGGQAGSATPFSSIYKRPTLSPYAALGFQGSNPLTGGTLGAMQGLVRQQQQVQSQMRQSIQQTRDISQLRSQVRSVGNRQNSMMNETIRPTGHASTFMNMSHYYPGF